MGRTVLKLQCSLKPKSTPCQMLAFEFDLSISMINKYDHHKSQIISFNFHFSFKEHTVPVAQLLGKCVNAMQSVIKQFPPTFSYVD